MKLLISSAGPLDGFIGGGQVYVQNLARELRRRAIDFAIVSPDAWSGASDGLFHVAWREWEGIRVAGVSLNPAKVSAGDRWSSISDAMLDGLRKVLDTVQPDVMHLNGLKAALVALGREKKIPTVVTAHHGGIACPAGAQLQPDDSVCEKPVDARWCVGCYCQQLPGGGAMGKILAAVPPIIYRPLGRALNQMSNPGYAGRAAMYPWLVEQTIPAMRIAVTQADQYIAPSRAIANVLIRNGTPVDRIRIVPHGISPLPAKPIEGLGSRPVRFGYVGQISRPKGVKFLLEAFSRLTPDSARLEIIGTPQRAGEKAYLEEAMKPLAGRDDVVLRGAVPHADVADAIARFDVLVLPAIYLEVFGLVILEAFSVGRPVIVTDCGGPAEIVRDGVDGLIVPPRDVDALARAMQSLIDDPRRIAAMASAIQPVRTLDQHVDNLEQILQSQLARSNSAVETNLAVASEADARRNSSTNRDESSNKSLDVALDGRS
jgi:glycosyltransferase involved in cell wall biosynthesis